MGFKQKLKRFLRKIVPVGRTYVDKKFKDQEKYIRKQFKEQERLIKLQQKNMEEMQKNLQKNLKEYIEQELVRRDNWAKMASETKRVADGRPVWVIKCPATEGEAKFRWVIITMRLPCRNTWNVRTSTQLSIIVRTGVVMRAQM